MKISQSFPFFFFFNEDNERVKSMKDITEIA